MDFFQKIGNTLSNTGNDIAKKTKDMSDISRLNHEITKQQEFINRTYSQIGKLYFDNYSTLDYPELKELCDSIKEANKKIEDFKSEITQIKGIINCPKCNAEVSTTATFCGNCGYKLKEDVINSESTTTESNIENTSDSSIEKAEDITETDSNNQ